MNLPLLAMGGGMGWPLPPTRNPLWLAPPAALGSASIDALDQLLTREELRRRKQARPHPPSYRLSHAHLAEIANAPAPPLPGLPFQDVRGGHGGGAANASLEDEVLEDEEEEEEEEQDDEEELLVDDYDGDGDGDQISETESMFEEEEASLGSLDVTGEDDLLDDFRP